MNQPENELKPRYSSIKHKSSSIFAKAAIVMAVVNMLIWLLVLLPVHALKDASTEQTIDGLSFILGLFIMVNLAGIGLASITFIRSKHRRELAAYGMLANVVMIIFNLSSIFY